MVFLLEWERFDFSPSAGWRALHTFEKIAVNSGMQVGTVVDEQVLIFVNAHNSEKSEVLGIRISDLMMIG